MLSGGCRSLSLFHACGAFGLFPVWGHRSCYFWPLRACLDCIETSCAEDAAWKVKNMSTRGCIARLVGSQPVQFRGVYHHWDSYPSGLGRTLFSLRNTQFRGDTRKLLQVLIDEHPSGWSTIVSERFGPLRRGMGSERVVRLKDLPRCYCHGKRPERGCGLTEWNATGSGVIYAYALSESKMLILASSCGDGGDTTGVFGGGDAEAAWEILAEVDLNGDEPDWDALDEHGTNGR